MTLQIALLLVVLGVLLGLLVDAAARNLLNQAFQSKLRQIEEHRRLTEEWSEVRAALQQRGKCPHYTNSSSKQDACIETNILDNKARRLSNRSRAPVPRKRKQGDLGGT